VALTAFLERSPHINTVYLCLDNDGAGQTAARKFHTSLSDSYPGIAVTISPPSHGKDYNEMLQAARLEQKQERADRQKAVGASL
jgi:DNA primase